MKEQMTKGAAVVALAQKYGVDWYEWQLTFGEDEDPRTLLRGLDRNYLYQTMDYKYYMDWIKGRIFTEPVELPVIFGRPDCLDEDWEEYRYDLD